MQLPLSPWYIAQYNKPWYIRWYKAHIILGTILGTMHHITIATKHSTISLATLLGTMYTLPLLQSTVQCNPYRYGRIMTTLANNR